MCEDSDDYGGICPQFANTTRPPAGRNPTSHHKLAAFPNQWRVRYPQGSVSFCLHRPFLFTKHLEIETHDRGGKKPKNKNVLRPPGESSPTYVPERMRCTAFVRQRAPRRAPPRRLPAQTWAPAACSYSTAASWSRASVRGTGTSDRSNDGARQSTPSQHLTSTCSQKSRLLSFTATKLEPPRS